MAEGCLKALEDGEWDLVVDTWSGAQYAVREAAGLLAERAGHYAYISSRSVYPEGTPAGANEDAPVVDGSPTAMAGWTTPAPSAAAIDARIGSLKGGGGESALATEMADSAVGMLGRRRPRSVPRLRLRGNGAPRSEQ